MNEKFIATFYTHFAALSSFEKMTQSGISCSLAPVPRFLSSSCGTCVRYTAAEPHEELMHEDLERIVRLTGEKGAYEVLTGER